LNAQQFRHVPAKGFLREPAFELTLQTAKESKKKAKTATEKKKRKQPANGNQRNHDGDFNRFYAPR